MRIIKYIISIFIFLFGLVSNYIFEQKKESLLIKFDTTIEGNYKKSDRTKVVFIINGERFIYDKKSNPTEVTWNIYPISVEKAKQKVNDYLEKKAIEFEKETGNNAGHIRNPGIYYYDDYFESIYVYDSIDNKIFPVSWEWSIE